MIPGHTRTAVHQSAKRPAGGLYAGGGGFGSTVWYGLWSDPCASEQSLQVKHLLFVQVVALWAREALSLGA
jgi:hypothetical protein